MNCRQTHDLISAYLDQELTGQQMLELRAHLGICDACAREWREVREVRRLLRSLVPRSPGASAQQRLADRLDREALPESGLAPLMTLLLRRLPSPRPDNAAPEYGSRPRGRRLASALVLSSVAVLAVANALAPPTGDAAGRVASLPAAPGPPVRASLGALPDVWTVAGSPSRWLAGPSAPVPVPVQQYTQPAARSMDVDEPLRDEAVSGYIQGTLAGYQTTADGR
ncbi:MAG: zf-HC2 domain-containing protein [Armatimonadetes bacterium]|nr:zf-HC2 domain-containing protein [Armatimonadota bacterium]